MTDLRQTARPDARLVRLHAERGDPQARLSQALADLEGAAWGLLFSGEAALAHQLAALLGTGTVRVDERLRVGREALANAGLAVAPLDGEWRGARAVWLLEPEEEDFARAGRTGVRVIVDGTLAPGGQWFHGGAALVTYRDSVTLTGHGDAPLSALFGLGDAPAPAAPAPSDLSVALALRDVATLPLRLARAARTTAQLADRLGGAAQLVGPTALLLAPDAAQSTPHALGGVMAAARSVPGGMLLTPGLDDAEATLTLLHTEAHQPGAVQSGSAQSRPMQTSAGQTSADPARPDQARPDQARPDQAPLAPDPRRDGPRPDRDRPDRDRRGRDNAERDRGRRDASRFQDRRGERPSPANQSSQPDLPERFTFENPEPAEAAPLLPEASPSSSPAPSITSSITEETWEPEIVYSDIAHDQVRLPTPVSSGPDAPNLDIVPDVLHQPQHLPPANEPEARPSKAGATQAATQTTPEPAPIIAPDLPGGPQAGSKEDPATDLTEEQAAIYARLREWRNVEAKRQDISRFIIASNATLAEIARRVPYTEADLKAVKGMGPERMKKYGQHILDVVRG